MIKALFFDIDGTLVSFKTHSIPQSALDAIGKAREKGVKVFIATGRPPAFIDNLGSLEYDGMICTNGSYIIAEGRVIHKNPIHQEDILNLAHYMKSHYIPSIFASDQGVIACGFEEANEDTLSIFSLLNIPVPKSAPIEKALQNDAIQIVAFFNKDSEQYIMSNVLTHCDANRWHPAFTDCIPKGTDKSVGIDIVCSHYGLDVSETMAFGDGGNDIGMLSHAGIGVAMGNASDEVKAAASYVTSSVDEDGIARALEKFCL